MWFSEYQGTKLRKSQNTKHHNDIFQKKNNNNNDMDSWDLRVHTYIVLKVKFSGKDPGSAHQIPSVSNSSGFPIFSTSKRAFWIIFAPVYVTTPAISIEYHLAPLEKQGMWQWKSIQHEINKAKTKWTNSLAHDISIKGIENALMS